MFCPLTVAQLKDLFPKVRDIESMSVTDPVDYLVGLDEAGLQPICGHKARGGGDLYVWKNSFGRCVGGRHKMIASAPEKNSANMFTIIATLFTRDLQYSSLQIPICPTYSKTMLQSNRKMASVQPPCGIRSSLTSGHDFAAEEEEWLAVNEREDSSMQIREVTAEEEQGK